LDFVYVSDAADLAFDDNGTFSSKMFNESLYYPCACQSVKKPTIHLKPGKSSNNLTAKVD